MAPTTILIEIIVVDNGSNIFAIARGPY